MIKGVANLRNLSGNQIRLAASLVMNFASRVPGIFGIFLILPLFRFSLGTDRYAMLLGALALGSTSSLLFGGLNVIGRRQLGAAFGQDDKAQQANAFVVSIVSAGLMLCCSLLALALYSFATHAPIEFVFVAMIVCLGSFLNVFDNFQVAFNSHYITAISQILFQTLNIVIAFCFPVVRGHVVLACLLIQGHNLLASLVAAGVLLVKRRYLLAGKSAGVISFLKSSFAWGISDGLLFSSLSFSVVLMNSYSDSGTAGWYATLMRLFNTILAPVALLLVPLSGYLRINWHNRSSDNRGRIIRLTLVIGFLYGIFSSLLLYVASNYYLLRFMKLASPGRGFEIYAIYSLFAAIICYKVFSSIVYILEDRIRVYNILTYGVVMVCSISFGAAFYVKPFEVLGLFCVLLVLLLGYIQMRILREI